MTIFLNNPQRLALVVNHLDFPTLRVRYMRRQELITIMGNLTRADRRSVRTGRRRGAANIPRISVEKQHLLRPVFPRPSRHLFIPALRRVTIKTRHVERLEKFINRFGNFRHRHLRSGVRVLIQSDRFPEPEYLLQPCLHTGYDKARGVFPPRTVKPDRNGFTALTWDRNVHAR